MVADFVKDNWDKVLSIIVAVFGAVFAVYKKMTTMENRLIGNEKKLDQHVADDAELRTKIDKLIEKMDRQTEASIVSNSNIVSHESSIEAMREDIKELRDDIKFLIRRGKINPLE